MNRKTHSLKTWPEPFDSVLIGQKRFEVRKNDRGFEVGDLIVLEEYSLDEGYTGRKLSGLEIGYILTGGQFGIEKDYIVMQLKSVTIPEQP